MCGRFVQVFDAHALERLRDLLIGAAYFDDELINALATHHPRSYNIAPTQHASIVHPDHDRQRLSSDPAHFGLIPSWAKERSISAKMINARSETLWEKPAFRGLINSRRAILPINGFYEWQAIPAQPGQKRTKHPWYIHRADESPMLLACVWDTWLDPEHDASPVDSFSIITTNANKQLEDKHHRMPVILEPESIDAWFDRETQPRAVSALLRPSPDGVLSMRRISTRVNRPANNDSELLQETSAEDEGRLFW